MKHLMLYEEWCSAGKLDTAAYQINEGDLSDLLHFVGDVSAAVADTVVPGSGAVLDVINMLSYWVEAHLASESTEKIKLILSGIIQAFAIFDPFNGISTALKTGLNKVISAITTKSPATIAAARVAAKQVSDGLTALLTGLTGFASKMVTGLSNSKFGSAIAWLSKKLGISNVLNWLKTFITQTAPNFIRQFLTKIRDTFNPTQAGANTASGEFNQLLARNLAKTAVNYNAAKAIHNQVSSFATTWNNSLKQSSQFQDPRIMARDNTYVAPKPLPMAGPKPAYISRG
jgi:hypothetical protein